MQPPLRVLRLIGLAWLGLGLAACQTAAPLPSPTLAPPRPIQTPAALARPTALAPSILPTQRPPTVPPPTVPPPTVLPTQPRPTQPPTISPLTQVPTMPPTQSTTQPLASLPSLEGTFWRLVAYTDANGATVPAVPDAEATLEFSAGKAHAKSGCNDAGGDYQQNGAQLVFGALAQTAMLCKNKELMDQEKGYFVALRRVAQFSRTGDDLRLLGADGATLILLRHFPPAPLIGTPWEVLGFRDRDALVMYGDVRLTVQFSAEGRLAGFAGCNQFTGPYQLQGGKIKIGPLATTRKACVTPTDVMRYEQVFLEDLARSTTLRSLGNSLELLADDGTVQVQLRVAQP